MVIFVRVVRVVGGGRLPMGAKALPVISWPSFREGRG